MINSPEHPRQRVRMPLWGVQTNKVDGSNNITTIAKFTNCYPEIVLEPLGKETRVYVTKRKGITQTSYSGILTSGYKASYGACVWTGSANRPNADVFSFIDSGANSCRIIELYTANPVGLVINNVSQCNSITETVSGAVSTLVATFENTLGTGETVWYFPEAGAWTQIVDVDFPGNAGLRLIGDPVHLDGYTFIMTTDGRIWNSDFDSLSSWQATSFISAQTSPDGGVGLAKHHDTIVAFGNYSIEFFRDAGNATGSPLQLIAERSLKIGAMSKYSNWSTGTSLRTIHCHEDDIYFLSGGSEGSGKRAIYRLRNFQLEKISTSDIEKTMVSNVNNLIGIVGSFNMHGMSHIMFRGVTGTEALCYCPDTNVWWTWTDTFAQFDCVIGKNIQSRFGPNNMAQSLFQIGSSNADSDGFIQLTLSSWPIDFGTNKRKFFHELHLIGDKLSGSGNTTIQWSDDDGTTFSSGRSVDLSTTQNKITGLGSSRRRMFVLNDINNRPLRFEGLELVYSEALS